MQLAPTSQSGFEDFGLVCPLHGAPSVIGSTQVPSSAMGDVTAHVPRAHRLSSSLHAAPAAPYSYGTHFIVVFEHAPAAQSEVMAHVAPFGSRGTHCFPRHVRPSAQSLSEQ